MSTDNPFGRWGWTGRNVTVLTVLTAMGTALLVWRWREAPGHITGDLTVTPVPIAQVAERIDPNTASWASMARLPRIGPATARAICAYRDSTAKTGDHQPPFVSAADLAKVHGIGPATIKAVEPYLQFPTPPTKGIASRPGKSVE